MDYYDPEKKVILAVDEWGIWVNNEPDASRLPVSAEYHAFSFMRGIDVPHIP